MIDESGSPVEHPDADNPDLDQTAESPRTGNATVDGVLTSLDGLDETPVDEHVAVFERAHEQLRSALDGARDA